MLVFINKLFLMLLFSFILVGCGGGSNTPSNESVAETATLLDTAPPVITIIGDITVSIEFGESYEDLGATALDNIDGDIKVSITGSVNTDELGQYTVTYSVIDKAGNSASASRIINVVDTIAPTIEIIGEHSVIVEYGSIYVDAGIATSDKADANVLVSVTNNVETRNLGEYIVSYIATDSAGNSSTATRTVSVIDAMAPMITINGEASIAIEFGSVYQDAGATALDAGIDTIKVTTEQNVDTTNLGEYSVTYNATDKVGNTAIATRIVNVVDTTLPIITLVDERDPTIYVDSYFEDQGATATDNVDGAIDVIIVSTVNTSVVNQYKIVYEATDTSGNKASVTKIVEVIADSLLVDIIEDKNFLACLQFNGQVYSSEVKFEFCGGQNIKTTKGIESLLNLSVLYIHNNQLKEIDVSNNFLLEDLQMHTNQIEQIDLKNNTLLRILDLMRNKLKVIDLTSNTELDALVLDGNELSEIDLTMNNKLNSLWLDYDVICTGDKCSLR
jgi:hypothetical protein